MRVTAAEALATAVAEMDLRIRRAFKDWDHAPDSVRARGVRIEVSLPEVDPMAWLLGQVLPDQIFWSSRDGRVVVAGIGRCHEIRGTSVEDPGLLFRKGRRVLADFGANPPQYFGGFAFSSAAVDEAPWPEMGASRFWIPLAEVVCREGKCTLACNLYFQRHVELSLEEVSRKWKAVYAHCSSVEDLPTLMCRRDHPDREGWRANVECALELIHSGVLDKLVLARKAVYTFAVPATAAEILAVLRNVTGTCYHFLIQPNAGVAFMGTPPECLYRREDGKLYTEALAGTRPRTGKEEEDEAYSRELMEDPKERREQEFVRKALIRQLHLLCEHVEADSEPEVLLLERKQHLISRLEGDLREDVRDADILRALHPTPAVGGTPRENALRELPRLEPFSRGWYAAPVGTFGLETAEFAVAIRSGLVHDRDVNVYSGAGIVEGSDPMREWEEIENKISDFVKVTRGRLR